MQKTIVIFCLCAAFLPTAIKAQVKIGDNPTIINANSLLELESTNKGFVFPRVALNDVSSPAPMDNTMLPGTIVYNTSLIVTGGSGPGLYIWNGSQWIVVTGATAPAAGWNILGNAATNSSINVIGTADNNGISVKTNNIEALHVDSLQNVSIGIPGTINKFEVLGDFKLHNGNFNVLHTPDLLPNFVPGIEFTGTQYNGADTEYMMNGIVKMPPELAGNGDTLTALTGYFNPGTGSSSFANVSKRGISLRVDSSNGSSGIELGRDPGVNIYVSNTQNLHTDISADTAGIRMNVNQNGDNNNLNSSFNLNRDNFNLNVNQWDNGIGTNGSLNMGTKYFNVNLNAPDTSSGLNFNTNGIYLNHNVGSTGNTGISMNDTSFFQNVNLNNNNRSTGINVYPASYNLNTNDQLNGMSTGVNINADSYRMNVQDNAQQQGFSFDANAKGFHFNINETPNNKNAEMRLDSIYSLTLNNPSKNSGIAVYQSGTSFFSHDFSAGNNGQFDLSENNLLTTFNKPTGNSSFYMNESQAYYTGNDFKLGLQTSAPQANLDVNGTYKLGSQGTVNKNMVSFAYALSGADVVPAASIDCSSSNFSTGFTDVILNLPPGIFLSSSQAAVTVSPDQDLPDNVSISFARMINQSQLKVRFINNGTASSQTVSGTLYITITEF